MGNSAAKFEIIHETIMSDNNTFSVKELCAIAGVSRSGYYNWVNSASLREAKEKTDGKILNLFCKRIISGGIKKAFAVYICGFCIWEYA